MLMHLVPTHDDSGRRCSQNAGGDPAKAISNIRNGLHSSGYMQVPLAMRYFEPAKPFCGRLKPAGARQSRHPRHDSGACLSSRLKPAGLPVAYGVCEALRAHQVYWADRESETGPMRFRQYLVVNRREGPPDRRYSAHRPPSLSAAEEAGGVAGRGSGRTGRGDLPALSRCDPLSYPLPFYYLARLDAKYYPDSASCVLCKKGIPVVNVHV